MSESDDIGLGPGVEDAGTARGGCRVDDIYRSEGPRLVRFFRRRLKRREDALDLVQEAFARFVGSGQGDNLRNPEAYLQRIARNLLVDRSRRAETKFAGRHVPLDLGFEVAVPPEQAYAIEADDVMRQYRRAVAELTPKTREVFLLHRVEELSYKEIAARLGISINTVEYHIARALVHIDKALDRD